MLCSKLSFKLSFCILSFVHVCSIILTLFLSLYAYSYFASLSICLFLFYSLAYCSSLFLSIYAYSYSILSSICLLFYSLAYCLFVVNIVIMMSVCRLYAKNPQFIYDFQCENLGPMSDMSLTETLNQIPVVQGLRVEASIDYYETLRMARIFNETWADPYR